MTNKPLNADQNGKNTHGHALPVVLPRQSVSLLQIHNHAWLAADGQGIVS